MSAHKRTNDYNENWEAEIEAYDKACREREKVYQQHALIIDGDKDDLTEEENLVLQSYLKGMSISEIAKEAEVDVDLVTGLLEVIKAKLSLID